MTINQGLFTSNTDLWATPQSFYNKMAAEFDFQTDVCANEENAKCENYYTEEMDGLAQEWRLLDESAIW